MFTLPTPKLGEISAITITTPDLGRSFSFYQMLGFKEVFRTDFPFPLIQITDGALLIMLRKDKTPLITQTYYSKQIDNVVKELEDAGITYISKPKPEDMIKIYRMESPDGMKVSIVTFVDGFIKPEGKTMLTMDPQNYSNPEKYVNKVCGMYGELAHPVSDIDKSMEFWSKLGFKVLSRMESPYPWAIISDGLSIVGLHQTKNFSSPTITFFASDMKDKIEKLRKAGLPGLQNTEGESNITLTTPEDQRINLFKLGM